MASAGGSCPRLTFRHGCKCFPDSSVTVEEVLIAVSKEVGAQNIKSASRMNKAVVVFLSEVEMVDRLVEEGLVIKDEFVSVLPLSNPSKRVVLSNVPPVASDEMLGKVLERYGKVLGSIKMIHLGCKSAEFKHVTSFRRQASMILNAQHDPLNVSLNLAIDGRNCTIFISSETMRCFVCGGHGHIRQNCPENNTQQSDPEVNSAGKDSTAAEEPRAKSSTERAAPAPQARESEADAGPGETAPANSAHTKPRPKRAAPADQVGESEADAEPINSACTDSDTQPAEEHRQTHGAGADNTVQESVAHEEKPELSQCTALPPDSDTRSVADSDNEFEDMESLASEFDGADSQASVEFSNRRSKIYSVNRINNFLDETKGQRKPSIENFFPDLKLFLVSCTTAMRKATLDELDKPKRYRLKKIMSTVRNKLHHK